jgi:hypothetical protein
MYLLSGVGKLEKGQETVVAVPRVVGVAVSGCCRHGGVGTAVSWTAGFDPNHLLTPRGGGTKAGQRGKESRPGRTG